MQVADIGIAARLFEERYAVDGHCFRCAMYGVNRTLTSASILRNGPFEVFLPKVCARGDRQIHQQRFGELVEDL